MKPRQFYPLLLLLAACKPFGPHDTGAAFRDSVVAKLPLSNSQVHHYLKEDTTAPDMNFTGLEVRKSGKYCAMFVHHQIGTYKMYIVDTTTSTLTDSQIICDNRGSNRDSNYSRGNYQVVNDTTIQVVQYYYGAENKKTEVHKAFTISDKGKITVTSDNG
ncbi:hypothetical protein [Chitinophaga sp. LS1]|uniref:hypothetical protein n=1 Tax=Chitinophaga sp. LS1 TaxID=3051176 RepID=UPI002AABA508|nr:hypothetical protein [Chitinophaga sp. LS1]WPV64704.1 hypothetical protein QQL36_23155 [Chitinophaga sp. LS1]